LEFLLCTLTTEVQCQIFHRNHVIWRTKITKFDGMEMIRNNAFIYFWYQTDSGVPNTSIYSAVSLMSPYYNYLLSTASTTRICWRCHSNSVDTGSRLSNISDVKTRKRRNVVRIVQPSIVCFLIRSFQDICRIHTKDIWVNIVNRDTKEQLCNTKLQKDWKCKFKKCRYNKCTFDVSTQFWYGCVWLTQNAVKYVCWCINRLRTRMDWCPWRTQNEVIYLCCCVNLVLTRTGPMVKQSMK
jgi:hypothetical protein